MADVEPVTLVYDLDCGFCRFLLGLVLRWDRAGLVRPLPLQDARSDELLGGMAEGPKMRSWHLVAGSGVVYSGGAGVAPLMDLLPGGRPLAALARRFPRATERIYRFGADNRGLFGRALPRRLTRPANLQAFRDERHR